ncbi:MAG: hypothetical protein E6F99_17385 [Actinobacteria bacterium]|nr:MAG: hypothetical protein E6F99_17385 [Actinomycetota bacterium]
MAATFLGVRHHSPACARLVASVIAAQRPAYVLVEGPADVNDRLDELLLGHELPVAVFTSYRDGERAHASWTPFCGYSPEWVALTEGRRCGAQVRFIDLPAWHPAFADRSNRYADAERRYADVVDRLCRVFAVDNVDVLWDHLFEIAPVDRIEERLAAYFDLVRDGPAGEDDAAREAYMARWVRAAVAAAGDRPVVVVTGGFHRPALIRLAGLSTVDWPDVPRLPEGAVGGSYLVPYSFRRLDAFDGYQSGMPSPGYYQRLWESGPAAAADGLTGSVVARLRRRKQVVSTADLIAARAMAGGLARLRGHPAPARTDVLDGLVCALVTEALDIPLPWAARGRLPAGTHPAVVEMVAALSGDKVGRLHPDTPLPGLVHDVAAELDRYGLAAAGTRTLDLTDDTGLAASRVLHRLRVLHIPGVRRDTGPATGSDPVLAESWTLTEAGGGAGAGGRLAALIEAGGYGATLLDAASAALADRIDPAVPDVGRLAGVLFDAALCGITELSGRVLADLLRAVGAVGELGPLGTVLATVLGLWRHDRLFGTRHSATLGAVITAAVGRVLWLAEGVRGGAAPADLGRLGAIVATRDAIVHCGRTVDVDAEAALAVMRRLSGDPAVPPDLRGAAFGFGWSLGPSNVDPVRAVRGAADPQTLGDWLAGLFAVAREEVLAAPVLGVLDELVGALPEHAFLVALPALRQAFAFFPPRERERIARHLLARRGLVGSARSLLRLAATPELLAEARALEARVDELLVREGLV